MLNRYVKIISTKVRTVILDPKEFWAVQKNKNITQTALLAGYFLPLLLMNTAAVFFGEFFRSSEKYTGFAILKSLREILLFVVYYFIGVYFTNAFIKTFGGKKNEKAVQKLVVFSITPLMLVSVVTGLFHFLYILDVLGIYSFYIFLFGAKELLEVPVHKRDSYLTLTIVVNFVIFILLSIILSKILAAYI